MAIKNRIAEFHDEMTAWRRDIHAHPETAFEEERTADIVAGKLAEFGIAVHRGLAKTGVVGVLSAGASERKIGLRADMDALFIHERNQFDYRSTNDGKMHACGHDGHTAMLLGAAKYLAETRRFDGTVYFIFQPAEENEAGGRVMVEEGLFERFPAEAVYGLHNMPGIEAGKIALMPGPMMASADFFEIEIDGIGAHGAFPHHGIDPIVVGAEMVLALQRIVSRSTDPMKSVVVSATQFHAGHTTNVIPETAVISGTTRTFSEKLQDMVEQSIRQIAEGVASAHGAKARVTYERRYPATINSPGETELAARSAAGVVGETNVLRHLSPIMGSEDFGWMLREKPGCYIWLGNGTAKGGCHVHNPNYDFNDDILTIGASYWATLAEDLLSVG